MSDPKFLWITDSTIVNVAAVRSVTIRGDNVFITIGDGAEGDLGISKADWDDIWPEFRRFVIDEA